MLSYIINSEKKGTLVVSWKKNKKNEIFLNYNAKIYGYDKKIDKILKYSQWNYKFSANSKILIIELNSLTLSFSDLINFLTLSELDLK